MFRHDTPRLVINDDSMGRAFSHLTVISDIPNGHTIQKNCFLKILWIFKTKRPRDAFIDPASLIYSSRNVTVR